MESRTEKPQDARPDGLPADAPPELRKAADPDGGELSGADEKGALDWLLGRTFRPTYTVRVDYETPVGMRPLTFKLAALDDRRLTEIDRSNRKGEGPFAELDATAANAQVVTEATEWIQDETGKRIDPQSDEFRGEVPDPAAAMELRMKFQPGLLDSLANEVRRISGYSADRVGSARRVLVDAGKDSSSEGA